MKEAIYLFCGEEDFLKEEAESKLISSYFGPGGRKTAREKYAEMIQRDRENNKPATACVECDECEPKCPQNIKISEQLKEAHEMLTSKD